MPFLFYEDGVPRVEVWHFDERTIIPFDVVRGFRPQTKIRIFIFVFDVCSLEGTIGVFEFGLPIIPGIGLKRAGTTPMPGLDKSGADALESTVLDEEIADAPQASVRHHPALRVSAYHDHGVIVRSYYIDNMIHSVHVADYWPTALDWEVSGTV